MFAVYKVKVIFRRVRNWFFLLSEDPVLYGGQRVVDFNEVLLALVLQDQSVEVQADPLTWVSPQPPLQADVWWVGGVRKARRLDMSRLPHVDIEGLPHWKKQNKILRLMES